MSTRSCVLLVSLLIGCGVSDRDPAATAMRFEELRAAGDILPLYDMLTPSDKHEVSQNAFPDSLPSGLNVSRVGVPNTTIDSARVLHENKDVATVAVYRTGPNMEQALAFFMQRALSGEDLSEVGEREVQKELKKLPRVTSVDTIRLQRVDGVWKVHLGVAERRRLDRLASAIEAADEGDAEDLRDRVAAYIAAVDELPGYASASDLSRARSLQRVLAIADSLEFGLQVESGYLIGNRLRGYVRNLSSVSISMLSLYVFDPSGDSSSVLIHNIPAGARKSVSETVYVNATSVPRVRVKRVFLSD